MLEVSCRILMPGMMLAKSVHSSAGILLLKEGEMIQPHTLDQLKAHEIEKIYIKWPESGLQKDISVVKDETRQKAMIFVEETLKSAYHSQLLELEQLRRQVDILLQEILSHDNVLVSLTSLRAIDDYTFGHSVNVCVLSLIVGITLEMSPEDLRILGMGAMVHDIGKLFVNQELLQKPKALNASEYAEMKMHATLGVAVIGNEQVDERILEIIRYHHEWYNGSGYPDGLVGDEIPLMARIVAICDVYDALTSDRVYKEKISAQEALEYLICMGDRQFDFQLLRQFLKYIRVYAVGMVVRLTTGEQASVLSNNPHWPTRPVVQVTTDAAGNSVQEYRVIDLSRKLGIDII
ncbi:HD-GYP domain-containing protein [Anoxynatronum buryatiense]|uniref:HD-GYP domain, c-di-GMP phosphodiesterase class II (Or its inactivated variant) n=1 Tax=Anoxynatronum buryatiense TaxID=489973 RepID=A0AA45WU52_9CLOT|nr:HD-GYP domain-containing protein [Anoxynatronum buryatiense]SMP45475.1 HD-GYP domain, c-di-GMP phosphodiesterase class II (or its inactivated variant) [Anoxynatronum buryatiense]